MSVHATVHSSGDQFGDFEEVFRQLADELSAFGEQYGFRIWSYRDPAVPFFAAQNNDRKKSIINELQTYLKICKTPIVVLRPSLYSYYSILCVYNFVFLSSRLFVFFPQENSFK